MILSYSGLSTFIQCAYKFKLTYIDKIRSNTKSLPLEMGSLCHEVMEIKLAKEDGYLEKFKEGFKKLADKYPEDIKKYDEKYLIFIDRLNSEEDDLEVVYIEKEFLLDFGKFKIRGFIDIVFKNKNGDYIIRDYKSSNKLYAKKDLKNSLQLGIYALAVEQIMGKLPVRLEYDMLFFNEKQEASFNKEEIVEEIKKLLSSIDFYLMSGVWDKNEHILCYWCPFYSDSLNFDFETVGRCDARECIAINRYKNKLLQGG